MASIRQLKKDINFLASELVSLAYYNKMIHGKITDEELDNYIANALEYRSNLIARANTPDGKDNPKLVKKYYQELRKDMLGKFEKLFTEVSK
jgi:hypothetical protein